MQGTQHPFVKIWVTVYISETIAAKKSKILQALRQCQMLFSDVKIFLLGGVGGAAPPNVNLGPHHIQIYLRNY